MSQISSEIHIYCPTAEITAMSPTVVPQVDEWERRCGSLLLILPNIHVVFYYRIHHSRGGGKVILLAFFNISTLPITHFNNSTFQVTSLLSVTFKRHRSYHHNCMSLKWGTQISELQNAAPSLHIQTEMSTN